MGRGGGREACGRRCCCGAAHMCDTMLAVLTQGDETSITPHPTPPTAAYRRLPPPSTTHCHPPPRTAPHRPPPPPAAIHRHPPPCSTPPHFTPPHPTPWRSCAEHRRDIQPGDRPATHPPRVSQRTCQGPLAAPGPLHGPPPLDAGGARGGGGRGRLRRGGCGVTVPTDL